MEKFEQVVITMREFMRWNHTGMYTNGAPDFMSVWLGDQANDSRFDANARFLLNDF